MIPLSEAILLGSTVIQLGRASHYGEDAMARGEGCALDMAVVAVRGSGNWLDTEKIWPWTLKMTTIIGATFDNRVRHPFGPEFAWTLEQFCDYVKAIEPPAVPESAPETSECPEYAMTSTKVREYFASKHLSDGVPR